MIAYETKRAVLMPKSLSFVCFLGHAGANMANNEATTSNTRTLLGDARELTSRVEQIVRRL
jgi:hypothetical protein